jgi:pimeloyl-ACP methyl ester carboxylesterase
MGEVVRSLTVKRIPEGSHWVAHEYPDLVNRYIREFMDGRQVGLQPDSRRPTSG